MQANTPESGQTGRSIPAYSYQLVLRGVREPAMPVEEVAQRLGKATRNDVAALLRLLNGGRRIIRRGLGIAAARKAAAQLGATGARCEVELELNAGLFRSALTPVDNTPSGRGMPASVPRGLLVPVVAALPRTVEWTSGSGQALFLVRNERMAFGSLLLFTVSFFVALALQLLVVGTLVGAVSSTVATAVGITLFFGSFYGLFMLGHIPRRLTLCGSAGKPLLRLVQQRRPWSGRAEYHCESPDGVIVNTITRRRWGGGACTLYDASGNPSVIADSAESGEEAEDAGRDLIGELIDLGVLEVVKEWAARLFGSEGEELQLRDPEGEVLAEVKIGKTIELRLEPGAGERAAQLALLALVAAGV